MNEEFLRTIFITNEEEGKRSMSGLINRLLDEYRGDLNIQEKPFSDKTVKAISREAVSGLKEIIKTPEEARKVVNADSPGFITKAHTARTKK